MAKELTILPSLRKSFNCPAILCKQQASAPYVAAHPTTTRICPSRRALGARPRNRVLLKPGACPSANGSETSEESPVYFCERSTAGHGRCPQAPSESPLAFTFLGSCICLFFMLGKKLI